MRISEEVRARVIAVAQDLGYRPNLSARGLRTKVSQTLGLISDTIATTQFAGEAIHGAFDAALEQGFLVLVAETEGEESVEERLIHAMLDRQVDGFIYASMYTRELSLHPLLQTGSVVLLNCIDKQQRAPAIIPDEVNAGRTAARVLIEADFRGAIWVIGGRQVSRLHPGGIFAGRERMEGIEEILDSYSVQDRTVVECSWTPEDGYSVVNDLLRTKGRPAALICLNDRLSFGAYQALSDAGLVVPGDVSVVSFDDQELASWLRPQLTTIGLPHYQLGRESVELLTRDEAVEPQVRRVPMPLLRRYSVRNSKGSAPSGSS